MNYQLLADEIATGPLSTELTGKTDIAIAAVLNEPRFVMVKSRRIFASTILAELGAVAGAVVLDKLESVSSTSPPVKWALQILMGPTGLDIGHTETRSQVTALRDAGVFTDSEAAVLLNMATVPASRAEIVGLGTVTYGDVSRALNGPWEA